jgi:hypothetical protein
MFALSIWGRGMLEPYTEGPTPGKGLRPEGQSYRAAGIACITGQFSWGTRMEMGRKVC